MHVVPFQFDNFSIRVIDIHGEPWFVGKDIAEALGYSDTVNAIKQHCKGVVKHHPISDSLGRKQNTRIINEPDLFRLIVHSQLPAAEQFEKWVFEEVLPAIRKTGSYQLKHAKPQTPAKQITEAAKVFKANFSIMRLIGCDKNAAAMSANQATHKTLGVNLLELNERTHLVAENQSSRHYTPTELGKQIGLSAIKVNRLLAAAGLQARFADEWEATPAGQAHSRRFDTAKRHGDGAPVTQLKWATSALPLIDPNQHQHAA